ncbi:tRNA preQ1(34) S-adenosylmethionine ribosyltransferase-isomerase QueA [Halobacteriovorax sp. JY17]|uniref:tRNA preQ1(34) S-adenosylmethionine ribosyltransferase-isomerase QueA n=1 Tax=Halobacteriovorax sp. JY17 TaxID=2014617 RepID=UPI000C375EBF|nr:tRNA preQ1(34) S-adenosylmethionine ribosyltransferase-isomerase QueA [Halobacteriovorax sp. JY17]PIK15576.1 MAG: tRNA preQ1(34) S-adenosylmethionine ribosyltransferase-isomerase QueA [Halobacteriovorax sp. JY17]
MSDVDLKLSNYDFDLPKELIAERPIPGRHNSKLLVYKLKSNEIIHDYFYNLPNYLPENSLLVVNQSKVFPCRLIGKKKTGGKCEIFLLTTEGDERGFYKALIKTSSKKNIGDEYFFEDGLVATVRDIDDGNFFVSFNRDNLLSYLESFAKIPIPPYIRNGESDESDKLDYQTVFAKEVGSVAAPTAGLHFTEDVFKGLAKKNIERAEVTLHVGLGTFAPVKTDNLSDHKMHSERFFVDSENKNKILNHKKIFAVGTTSLRVLESCHNGSEFEITPGEIKETSIFLHPGVSVNSINGLITNFHLPKSTLLMLVSSLIGREKTLELYQEAIANEYRFFSYGDSMLILREE